MLTGQSEKVSVGLPLKSSEWQLPAPKAPPKKHFPGPIARAVGAKRIAAAMRLMLNCMLKLSKSIENVLSSK